MIHPRVWNTLVAIGGIGMFSAVFYAFTGMGLWAPIGEKELGREFVLFLLHVFAIGLGFVALIAGKEQSNG